MKPIAFGKRAESRALIASVLIAWMSATHALASPRVWQPVILKGAALSELMHARVDRLEVLAVHHGKLEPIPFQIDAVLPSGDFVLPEGPQGLSIDRPAELGSRDEMVMMMFDLGERAPAGLPEGALEVMVADPLGGPIRYAYVAAVDNPARSPVHYVDYDPELKRIETRDYQLGFKQEYPDEVALHNRNGEPSPSLIDRFELFGRVKVLRMLRLTLTQDDVDSRMLAYHAGPVRVIRRIGHRIRIVLGFHSPEVSTVEFFYRDVAQAPFTMKFPFRRLFSEIRGRIDMDFINLRGFSLLASGLDQPLEIGSESTALRLVDPQRAPSAIWLALRGEGRLLVQTFAPSPELAMIKRQLFYRPQAAPPGPAPEHGVSHIAIGIETSGWERLSGGSHQFDPLIISVPDSYGPQTVIAELNVPPVATVRPAGEPAPGPGKQPPQAANSP